MRIPGFGRRDRGAVDDPAAGQVYVERRPGESTEAFEARLAAVARERAALAASSPRRGRVPPRERDTVRIDPRPVPKRRPGGGLGLVSLVVVLVAALGLVWTVLAAREGSFAAGGAVVDRKIAEVTQPARLAANQAVDRTGAVVQNAGQALASQGQRIRQTAQ